jgi:phage shock protein A
MKTLRRWTSSITSSFEWMISQVENHDALINASIKEVQSAGARAQVQFKRMQNDGQNMRKRLTELRSAAEQWRARAVQCAMQDEKRALECLRRQKRLQKDIGELESQEREHAKVEKQLAQDLVSIDERLQRLRQQRNTLRTRQSRAEALQSLQSDDGRLLSEIDDIFERWETKVAEYEVGGVCTGQQIDELEATFENAEEEAALRAELQTISAEALESSIADSNAKAL